MSQVLIAAGRPRLLAAVRRQATPATIGTLIQTSGVWDLMRTRGIKTTGHNVVLYWDEPRRDLMHSAGGIPVDIGAEITEPFEGDAELQCTATPAGRFISAVHVGLYARLGAAYETIHAAVRTQGLRLAGPYWEFYGHWNADPEKAETTVYYAIAD